jgi:hypothetical protein
MDGQRLRPLGFAGAVPLGAWKTGHGNSYVVVRSFLARDTLMLLRRDGTTGIEH